MSTPIVQARTSTYRLNRLAVVAIVLAVIAAAGLWVFGAAVLAVFAVGTGHMALNQIGLKLERGRGLAIAALIIGYGIGTLALINTFMFVPRAFQQFVN
jgi:xanthine/uracil permease